MEIAIIILAIGAVWALIKGMDKPDIPVDDHKHEWSKWHPTPYGYETVNARACKTCGLIQQGKAIAIRIEEAKRIHEQETLT